MARFLLDFGAEVDLLTQRELEQSLARSNDSQARALVRGVDSRPMPRLTGQASDGVLMLGQQDPTIGPRQGYAWTIMRLNVSGLTSGATPDVVGFYPNGTTNPAFWQLTGASPQEKFARLQLVIRPGTNLVVASIGTFAATATIVVTGEIIEIPAEMLPKLAL